jgi:Leucine-rich repeat (LRR) protein
VLLINIILSLFYRRLNGNRGDVVEMTEAAARDFLRDLTNLTHLDMSYNQMGPQMPAGMLALPSLRQLHIKGNRLTKVPAEIRNLSNLEVFSMQSNTQLTTIDMEDFRSLTRLTTL